MPELTTSSTRQIVRQRRERPMAPPDVVSRVCLMGRDGESSCHPVKIL